jgi:hypothetical protein
MALEEYEHSSDSHDASNQFPRSNSQKMEVFCSKKWYVTALQQYLQKLTAYQQIQNPTAVRSTTSLLDSRLKQARS